MGSWLIPDLISSFRADHPHIRFVLEQIRDEQVSTVLEGGHVDLEISALRPRDPSLRWRPFLSEPLRLALPLGHPLAARADLRLAEVSDQPFICLRTSTELRRQSDEMCTQAGFQPRVAFESDDLQTIRGFVAAGLGVAIVPAAHEDSQGWSPALAMVKIADQRAAREIGLVWSAERRLLPSATLFRQHVVDRASAGLLPKIAQS